MGIQIALTGLIVFVVCYAFSNKDKPRSDPRWITIPGVLAFFAMPIGLLIQIWM